MEPLRRWKRLGGVLEASHSTLMRRSPEDDVGELGDREKSARPGASWMVVDSVWSWCCSWWSAGLGTTEVLSVWWSLEGKKSAGERPEGLLGSAPLVGSNAGGVRTGHGDVGQCADGKDLGIGSRYQTGVLGVLVF